MGSRNAAEKQRAKMISSDRSAWKTQEVGKDAVNRRQIAYKIAWLLLFVLAFALWIYLVLGPFGRPRTHIMTLGDGEYPIASVESIPFVEFEKENLSKIDDVLYHNQDAPYSEKYLFGPETRKGVKSIDSAIIFLYFRCAAINGKAYFITSEFNLEKPNVGLLQVESVIEEISSLPSKNKLVVIPAGSIHYDPRLGIFADDFPKLLKQSIKEKKDQSITVYFPHENFEASNTSILLSSSLTTHFFCEGMAGQADFDKDRKIEISEIGSYISESVTDWNNASRRIAPITWSPQNASLLWSVGNENEKEKDVDKNISDTEPQKSNTLPIHLLGNKRIPQKTRDASKINSSFAALVNLIETKESKDGKTESPSQITTGDSDAGDNQKLKEREQLATDWESLKSHLRRIDNLGQDRIKKIPYPKYPENNFNLKKALKESIARKQQATIEDLQASLNGIAPKKSVANDPPGDRIDYGKILDRSQYENGNLIGTNTWSGSDLKMHSLSLQGFLGDDQGDNEKSISMLENFLNEETPEKLKEWLKSNQSLNQFSEVVWSNHVLQHLSVGWKDAQALIRTRILSEKVSAWDSILPNVFRNRIIQLDRFRLQSEAMTQNLPSDSCTMDRFIGRTIEVQQQYQMLIEDFEKLHSVRRVWLTELESAEDVLRLYCNPYSIPQPDVSFNLVLDWIERLHDLQSLLHPTSDIENAYLANIQKLGSKVSETGKSIRAKLYQPTANFQQSSVGSSSRPIFDKQLLNCPSIPVAMQTQNYLDVLNEEYKSALADQEGDAVVSNRQIIFFNPADLYLKNFRLLRQTQRAILYLRYLSLIGPIIRNPQFHPLPDSFEVPFKSFPQVEANLYRHMLDLENAQYSNGNSDGDKAENALREAGEAVQRFMVALSSFGPPRADSSEKEFKFADAVSRFRDWRDTFDSTLEMGSWSPGICLETVIGFQSERLTEQLSFSDESENAWIRERLEAYSEFLPGNDPSDEANTSTPINMDIATNPLSLRHDSESVLELDLHNDRGLKESFQFLIVFDTDDLEIKSIPREDAVPYKIRFGQVQDSSMIFPPKGSLISNSFHLTEETKIPITLRLVKQASAKGPSTPIEIFLLSSSEPTITSNDPPSQREVSRFSRLVLRRCIPIELPHGEIQYLHQNQSRVTNSLVTNETLFPNQSHTLRMSVPIQSACDSGLFADVFPIDSRPSSRTTDQWKKWVSTQSPLMRISASDNKPTETDPKKPDPPGSSEPDKSSSMNPKSRGFTGLLYALGYPDDETRTLRFVDFDIARPREYLTPKVSFDANINRLRIDFVFKEKSNRRQLGPVSVQTRFIGLDPQSVTGKSELNIPIDPIATNRLQFEFSDPMPETLKLEIDVDHFPRAFIYSVDSTENRMDIQPVSSQPSLDVEGFDDRLFLSLTQADELVAKIDLQASNQQENRYSASVVQESIEKSFEPVGIAKMTDDRQTVLELTALPIPGSVRIDSHVSDFQLRFPPDALYDRPTKLIASIEKDGLSKQTRSIPLFIDTQPPTIESLDLSPGTRVVSAGDAMEVNIGVADKGSGVASVELVAIGADIDKPPADAKWTSATFDAENIWKCSLSTGEKAAKLQLFVRAIDSVGNAFESRLTPITVIAKGKSEAEQTLKLFGRVLHRGKPVDSGTVTLVAETKAEVKTKPKEIRASIKPSGNYLLDGIPKGKYTATIKLIINNKVIMTKQELDLSDPKSLSINQDLSTDKAPR